MTKIVPVAFVWQELQVVDPESGEIRRVEAMVPQSRYGKVCKRQFVSGEEYPLAILEARSRASHNGFFAQVGEGYKNLPEKIAARWREVDHFRKWCLIETGWYDEQEYNFDTERDADLFAKRFAAFCRAHETYVRIFPSGKKVIVRSAKSQSAHAMDKETFERSKRDVLDEIGHLVGVSRAELKKAARHQHA